MTLLRPAVLTLTLLAAPVMADTTPEAVWQLLQKGAGPALTATTSRRGDALVVTHGQAALDDGAVLLLPDFTLRQLPDGAVALELPPRFPLVLDLPQKPGDPDKLTLQVAAPDLSILLRDIGPEAVDFSLRAGSVSASLDPLAPTLGVKAPRDLFLALAAADLTLEWKSNLPEREEAFAKAAVGLGTLHLEMRIDLPEEQTQGSFAIDLSAVKADLDGFMPAGGIEALERMETADGPQLVPLLALLDQGMRLQAALEHGPLAFVIDMPKAPDGPVATDMRLASGDAQARFDRNGGAYDFGAKGVAMTFRGDTPELPLDEFALSADELRYGVQVGLPTDVVTAPEWSLLYRFAGITVSDELLDLADPGRILPRDPMSLILDARGTYRPDPRLLAGGWVPGPKDLPVTEATVTLTEALVEGAGLRVEGAGDLAFDFSDRSRYIDETPVPEGKLSFLTIGANTLIERLVSLGLVGSDELSGLRFGLMFLGRPVPGQEDHLATDLEFKAGAFFLNGQKIR